MAFQKEQVEQIHDEVNQALNQVGERYGVNIQIDGNVRFSSTEFKAKIIGFIPDPNVEDKLQAHKNNFEKHCHRFGLTEFDFRRQFHINGKILELVDIKPKATKRPFVCRSILNHKMYKVPQYSIFNQIQ